MFERNRFSFSILGAAILGLAGCCAPKPAQSGSGTTPAPSAEARDLAEPGERHLKNVHQLTFGGENAEAYWSFTSDELIFQTTRAPYKCDQIMRMPISGDAPALVSQGKGRQTCSYFLPDSPDVIYASTFGPGHENGTECPTPPDMSKGYVWGLFDYDIYRQKPDGTITRLTDTPGYDAEGTVCGKDGSIVFTSVRDGDLELYRMNADGSNVQRLTHTPGYDGGAFFSADCSKIVWRASRPTGKALDDYNALLKENLVRPTQLELYIANADGTDARQVTYLGAASFGPFLVPAGNRILFSSNYPNPRGREFDIWSIHPDGTGLERITTAAGFDGFPMISPDGTKLAFSSNRRDAVDGTDGKQHYRVTGGEVGDGDTNVFVADWVEDAPPAPMPEGMPTGEAPTAAAERFRDAVAWLADDAREGRDIGSEGLADSLAWVQAQFDAIGIHPGINHGVTDSGVADLSYEEPFDLTVDYTREAGTHLTRGKVALPAEQIAPLAATAAMRAKGALLEVGYGVVEPAGQGHPAIDDYKGKNAKGKVVLVHRYVDKAWNLAPADASRLGDLHYKAFQARQHGAVALLVVDDGDPSADEAAIGALGPHSEGDIGIPVLLVSRAGAAALRAGKGDVDAGVQVTPVTAKTANVVGILLAADGKRQPGVIVIGAHVDHLGMGGESALDREPAIHNGADDNASGVAALLEVARLVKAHEGELAHNVYFVAFSGEERGVLGSTYMVEHMPTTQPVLAMLNMDMVGRMRSNHVSVFGGESATEWKDLVPPACAAAAIDCSLTGNGYGPSDHMPFYIAGAPVLHFFTDSHLDYHTATDDADKINAAGGARVAQVVATVALQLGTTDTRLTYQKVANPMPTGGDARLRGASLGTIPSYGEEAGQPAGMLLSDVVPGGPAEKAGLKKGDRIVMLGTTEIRSVHDLMYVLQAAKPGETVKVTFVRDGKKQTVDATYAAPRARH